MLTKGAIGNLVNRYRAVLKKCRLINVFGSLAVVSMLVLGSAGMAAGAVEYTAISPGDTYKESTHYTQATIGDVSGVELTITGGTYYRIGAVQTTNGKAYNNSTYVYGGQYTVKGSEGFGFITSALATKGEVRNNKTKIENIDAFDAYGALGVNSKAYNNTLQVKEINGDLDSALGATLNGTAYAENNSVTYSGNENCTIVNMIGARLTGSGTSYNKNKACYNSAKLISGIVTYLKGARVGTGDAISNNAIIEGGQAYDIYGGQSFKGSATGNNVFITGGTVTNSIIGGEGTVKAINNTIIISGSPDLSNASIYGGNGPAGADFRTGNTLNIKTSGLTAKNIYNFDTINFTVASKVHPGDKPLLELKGGGETDLTDVAVSVTVEPRSDLLKKGDRIHLLKNDSNLVGEARGEVASIPYGNFVTYDFALDQTQTTLDLEVVNASTTPQAKSLSEGRTAMLAFVNQGAELIAERGIEAARQEALEGSLTPFLAGQGGKSRYDTGSHVDVTGFSLIAGLTSAKKTEIGTATMAAFFESGWADYDAHNSFASAASVNADGNTRYYGGGLLAHMAFPDFGPGHAYAETSLRTGWAETDYHSGDLRDSFGNTAAYDSGSAYYGAHFGLGYEWTLSDVSALDFYAKYFWTHQEGDHVRVMSDPIHFESADSHRSRFGVRYEHEFKTDGMVVKPFIGAAYEYEYDGDVAGTAYGFAMDKPSLRGGTGAGELGVTLKSSENSAFSLNLSVQGYTGTREGVSGSFLLNYRF